MIHALKYGGQLAVARFLASAIVPLITEPVDLMVPMPLSAARLRERGFNQAHEIARHIARATATGIAASVCRRVRDTPPQATLPWRARARNIRGAFACDEGLDGLRVAVVDDVVTTAATLNEISRVLKRAGAVSVTAWSAARTLRRATVPVTHAAHARRPSAFVDPDA
jgi:ComF family protein